MGKVVAGENIGQRMDKREVVLFSSESANVLCATVAQLWPTIAQTVATIHANVALCAIYLTVLTQYGQPP